MRVLVISDSHGTYSGIETAIETHPEASHLIFLGDGASQMENIQYCYPNVTCHILAGNCDWSSDYPNMKLITLSGVKILACHGHTYDVKYGIDRLLTSARNQGAQVALYGHTHCAYEAYHDGIYVMNPGSIALPRDTSKKSYGILDMTDKGIMTSIAKL